MDHPPTRFTLNSANLVTELFEDEMVAVDVDTGRYFSLNLAGATIFGLLAAGHDVATVSATVGVTVGEHVAAFAEELVAQGLLRPRDGTPAPAGSSTVALPVPDGSGAPLDPPQLTAYTDMQDLLLLDPIHDVDAAGWPVRPPE